MDPQTYASAEVPPAISGHSYIARAVSGFADVMSYNSLRRFLPTLAGVLDFDMVEVQSVGNWIDIPGSACLVKARASHPMSMRYAADQHMSALLNKHTYVVPVLLAVGAVG